MKTPIRPSDITLTLSGSIFSERLLWPRFWPHRIAVRRTAWGSALDTKEAVDAIVWLEQPGHASLKIRIQERFRRPEYSAYRDITVSDTCEMSETRCELHHFDRCDWLLYGYFDASTQTFGETVLVSVSGMLQAANSGSLELRSGLNPRQRKRFVTASIDDLERLGLLIYHYRPGGYITH